MTSVLIVDDDTVYRTFLRCGLARAGFRVLVADNGKKALALLRDRDVAVLVTDIFMVEMDGLELILAAKAARPDLRIIAISGGSARLGCDFLRAAVMLGAAVGLPKPFGSADLIAAIEPTAAGVAPPRRLETMAVGLPQLA